MHRDDEFHTKPIGTVLVVVGVLLLILTIGGSAGYLHGALSSELAVIAAPGPIEIDLPAGRDLILTRDAGLAADEETFQIRAAVPESATITQERRSGWLEIDEQRQDILARLVVHKAGPVTVESQAGAYPLVVRHDPIALAKRTLVYTAIAGTLVLALIASGVSVMIRNVNARARHRTRVVNDLIGPDLVR